MLKLKPVFQIRNIIFQLKQARYRNVFLSGILKIIDAQNQLPISFGTSKVINKLARY